MKGKLKITVGTDGKFVTEVNGVTGPACRGLTRFLEELGTVTDDRETLEMYAGQTEKQKETLQW